MINVDTAMIRRSHGGSRFASEACAGKINHTRIGGRTGGMLATVYVQSLCHSTFGYGFKRGSGTNECAAPVEGIWLFVADTFFKVPKHYASPSCFAFKGDEMPSFCVHRSVILVLLAMLSVAQSALARSRLAYVSRQQCPNGGQRTNKFLSR